MNIIIPYCHKDAPLAGALLTWMLKLDNGLGDLSKVDCLILASKLGMAHSASEDIAEKAKKVFRNVDVQEADIIENGWPGAPNQMFVAALGHAVRLWPAGKFLWLEPDALPLSRDWYSIIKRDATNSVFFGMKVATQTVHMSGVAVYPCNARKLAPALEQAIHMGVPFDVHGAVDVMKKATWTDLIQHVPDGYPKTVLRNTRLYHPIYPGFIWRNQEMSYEYKTMTTQTKYYKVQNASLPVKAGSYSIRFEPFGCIGNLPTGVYSTNDEAIQIALQTALDNPRTGVKEIGGDEHAACLKKKVAFNARRQSLDSGFLRPLTDRQGQAVVPSQARKSVVEVRPTPKPEIDMGKLVAPKEAVMDPVSLGKVTPGTETVVKGKTT